MVQSAAFPPEKAGGDGKHDNKNDKRETAMEELMSNTGWRIVIHEAEEGGYWGEVPAMPGCVSEGETIDECRANVLDAVKGCCETYLKMAMEKLSSGKSHNEVVFA